MKSLTKWIWGGIKAICRHLLRVAGWLWDAVSSWVTWVITGITYAIDKVTDWIGDAIRDGLADISGALSGAFEDNLADAPDPGGVASYYLGTVLQMDEAFVLLVTFVGIWLAARAARLLMVPIRALLELL